MLSHAEGWMVTSGLLALVALGMALVATKLAHRIERMEETVMCCMAGEDADPVGRVKQLTPEDYMYACQLMRDAASAAASGNHDAAREFRFGAYGYLFEREQLLAALIAIVRASDARLKLGDEVRDAADLSRVGVVVGTGSSRGERVLWCWSEKLSWTSDVPVVLAAAEVER